MKYYRASTEVSRDCYLDHMIDDSSYTREDFITYLKDNDLTEDELSFEDWVAGECEDYLEFLENEAFSAVGD